MINKFTITALCVLMSVLASAQINIGNTSAPNDGAILDVSNTTAGANYYKGIYLPQVALTSTSVYQLNTIVETSSVLGGMMVYNTATSGTGDNAVVPGLYIWQDNLWNLVSISAKKNTASSLPVVFATLNSSGVTLTPGNWSAYKNTGASITLPANSKYIVNANILLSGTVANNTWVRSGFSDYNNYFSISQDVIGANKISGNFLTGAYYSLMQGTIILNNTSNVAKTYYYWVGNVEIRGSNSTTSDTINSIGNSGAGENEIYAIPSN